MKKRYLSLLLALTLVLCAVPAMTAPVSADHADYATHMRDGYDCVYSCDFEEDEDYSEWWWMDSDQDGYAWFWSYVEGFRMGYGGSEGVYSMSFLNDYGQLYPDNWLYSPEFYVEPGTEVSFLLNAADAAVPGDHLGLYICTGNTANPEYGTTKFLDDIWTESNWVGYTYGLDDYAGQTVRFAFHHDDCDDHYGVVLDCFNVWYPTWQMGSGIGNHSAWAGPELSDAFDLGLIPDCLLGVDLTRNITRAEFAALAVKLYELRGGYAAPYVSESPFRDTSNQEVLQAAALGIVNGLGNGIFGPNQLLTREQSAVMLSRAFLSAIGESEFEYMTPAPFRDDYRISDWARNEVYFMTAYGVLAGTGNGYFEPLSNCTREQGICIAERAYFQLPG